MIKSHSMIFKDFESNWYKNWAGILKQNKEGIENYELRANKFWQNAIMAQILSEQGLVRPGKKGVGFGVGQERLPAAFAKKGVEVTATDQDFRTDKAKHWQEHELAFGIASLNKLGICPNKNFKEKVSFKAVDMTKVSKDLFGKYDFAWSNCALGHLGSIEAGQRFIVESAKCLNENGVAVHTTEVNVMSDNETVDSGDTVIFRPKDIYKLALLLQKEGYALEPLTLDFGDTEQDQYISVLPKFGNAHSKLQVGGHIMTQVVLIVKPLKSQSTLSKLRYRNAHKNSYRNNVKKQQAFAKTNPFIQSVHDYEKISLDAGSVTPVKKSTSVTLKDNPKYIYLEYENNTSHPVFGMHERLYTTKPIALATSGPEDRISKFKSEEWYNKQANRPSIYLCTRNARGEWEQLDYIRPHSKFFYKVVLDSSKLKEGTYTESFGVVQEGVRHIPGTEVIVTVKVT